MKTRIRVNSLQTKIFLICLVIALVILALTGVTIYRSAAATIEKNAIQYLYENIRYANDSVNGMLDDALAASLIPAANQDTVMKVLTSEAEPASYQWFLEKQELERFLSSLIYQREHVLMMSVVCDDGRVYQAEGEHLLWDILSREWYREKKESLQEQLHFDMDNHRAFLVRPLYYIGNTVTSCTRSPPGRGLWRPVPRGYSSPPGRAAQ